MSGNLNGKYVREHISDVMTWEQKCVSFVESLLHDIADEIDNKNHDKKDEFTSILELKVNPIPETNVKGGCLSVKIGGSSLYIHGYT